MSVPLSLLAVGALGGGVLTLMHHDGQGASSDACRNANIQIAVPPSLSGTISEALKGYTGSQTTDGCHRTYTVKTMADKQVVDEVRSGTITHRLWITDNPQAYDDASAAGHATVTPGPAFAATPVVISAPPAQLASLGSPTASWANALAARPALTVGDATTDRASAIAVTRAAEILGVSPEAKKALGGLALTQRPTIPNDAPHVTTEAELIRHRRTTSATLDETALQGGSPLLTLSVAPLVWGDSDTTASAKELTDRLSSPDGQKALAGAGYRDATGKHTPSGAPQGAESLSIGATPAGDAVETMLANWRRASAPLRMTGVVDVSGSMAAKVDGISRIVAVARTASEAVAKFPPTTSASVWEFSSGLDGNKDYRILTPMGPVSDPAHKKALLDSLARLPGDLKGDTGLYDTILAAYQSAQQDYHPGQWSTITVSTDGRNADPTGGLTLDQLRQKLRQIADPKRPVTVGFIAIGDDVDLDAMNSIVQVTGGSVYRAATPADVPDVLRQSLFNRS